MTAARRLSWTILFGIAFGWVETAVVVYLRHLYYPDGFQFPLRVIEAPVLIVELCREAATLLMLVAVAALAGRRFWERFAIFCVAFGVWDLVYYAGLKITLGWPASLAGWDILFLLPLPWIAPVYAPVSVAVMMIFAGIIVVNLEAKGYRCHADLVTWALGLVGTVVLLYSFMRDTAAGMGQAMPQPYPVALLVVGDILLAASCVRFVWLSRRERRS